jgi:NAD(P)H-dependent FMN reductase
MKEKTVLLLNGSPKGQKSSSASLGLYLVGRLKERGFQGRDFHVPPLVRSADGLQRLAAEVNAGDLVICTAPLYIDSIPAPLIAAMEYLCEKRQAEKPAREQPFVALVNSGFPEPFHSSTALAIYREFAAEAGFAWAGGLAFASGQAVINGKALDKAGFMARNARKSLDLAAAALAEGKPIPDGARALAAKPMVPVPMFLAIGNHFWWRSLVKDKATWKAIRGRPYEGKG